MIRDAAHILLDKQLLTRMEAAACMEELLSGNASSALIGAFLGLMATRAIEKEEYLGFLEVIWSRMIPVDGVEGVVDLCGTGGDRLGSFNISTAAALTACAAGAKVAKCGNRSSSSACGSADLLEAVGVSIELNEEEARRSLETYSFAFFFTPAYHPAIQGLSLLRKDLGFRTIFNLLGPLGNPVKPKRRVLGVSVRSLAPIYAEILASLEVEHALVVHGMDGMDEISLSSPSQIYEIRGASIKKTVWDPHMMGLGYVSHNSIRGGTPIDNVKILKDLFNRADKPHRFEL